MSDSLNKKQTATSDHQPPVVDTNFLQHGSPPVAPTKLHLNPKADAFTPNSMTFTDLARVQIPSKRRETLGAQPLTSFR